MAGQDDQASKYARMVQLWENIGLENEAERFNPWTPSMGYHDIIIIVYYLVIGCNATRNK